MILASPLKEDSSDWHYGHVPCAEPYKLNCTLITKIEVATKSDKEHG